MSDKPQHNDVDLAGPSRHPFGESFDCVWLDSLPGAWSHSARCMSNQIREMLAMLRELEWSGSPAGECPVCGGQPAREVTDGAEPIPGTFLVRLGTGTKRTVPAWHTPDCKLSKLLRELP